MSEKLGLDVVRLAALRMIAQHLVHQLLGFSDVSASLSLIDLVDGGIRCPSWRTSERPGQGGGGKRSSK